MIKPEQYPADAFAVNGAVVSELAELKRAGGDDAADARPADYGLEKPVGEGDDRLDATRPIRQSARRGRSSSASTIPGTDVVAARVEGDREGPLRAGVGCSPPLKKSADDFESREVFGGPTAGGRRGSRSCAAGAGSCSRAGTASWWLAEPIADLADAGEVDRLVGRLTALRVNEFVHAGEDLAALGLNPPLFRVSPDGGEGRRDGGRLRRDALGRQLRLRAARRPGPDRRARRSWTSSPRRPRPSGARALGVVQPRRRHGGSRPSSGRARFALEQKDGGWTADGRPVLAAAADDVLDAISATQEPGLSSTRPRRRHSPRADGDRSRSGRSPGRPGRSRCTRGRGTWWRRVSSRPGGFVVAGDAPDKIEAAFPKAVTAPTPAPTKK